MVVVCCLQPRGSSAWPASKPGWLPTRLYQPQAALEQHICWLAVCLVTQRTTDWNHHYLAVCGHAQPKLAACGTALSLAKSPCAGLVALAWSLQCQRAFTAAAHPRPPTAQSTHCTLAASLTYGKSPPAALQQAGSVVRLGTPFVQCGRHVAAWCCFILLELLNKRAY
jgi:hypothetical protein